jgi:hypothetical protein
MNKLAVFVEGYTEVVFVEKLIEEIAGKPNVLIEHREIRGSSSRRTFARIRAAQPNTGQRYFVLIVDCGGDRLVKDRIREEHDNLSRAGYSGIIGLRDVRPDFTHSEIPQLEAGLRKYIKTSLIPVEFILAILEIEAWFLAEVSHFPRIHPAITVPAIIAALGFNPVTDNMELRLTPAEDLNNCYALGGKNYQKHLAKDTVEALDYAAIYMGLSQKFSYLERLIRSIEAFLS